MKRFRFIAVILSAAYFLSACAALPHQSADGQSTPTQTSESADSLAEEYTTEVPPDDNSLEIAFRAEALQTKEVPLCNGEHGSDRAFEYDQMHCALYQIPGSSDWFLCITLDGISYDMGLVGNLNTDIDRLIGSLIEKTSISQETAVYRLLREESFNVITTTYFAADNTLVPLYTVPGPGMQYDIDLDGQEETVANGGASTMPNYLLYEWEITDGQVRIADLKAQLSCDTLVLDDTQLCFIAGTKTDGKWQDTVYEYRGTQLTKK